MENLRLLKIPDEIIEGLCHSPCRICGNSEPNIIGALFPDNPDEWEQFCIILYSAHYDCLDEFSPDEMEDLLKGELAVTNALGMNPPFCGLRCGEME